MKTKYANLENEEIPNQITEIQRMKIILYGNVQNK